MKIEHGTQDVFLPPEMWSHILGYLPVEDVVRASEVCRDLYHTVQQEHLWRDLTARTYPGVAPPRLAPGRSWKTTFQDLHGSPRAQRDRAYDAIEPGMTGFFLASTGPQGICTWELRCPTPQSIFTSFSPAGCWYQLQVHGTSVQSRPGSRQELHGTHNLQVRLLTGRLTPAGYGSADIQLIAPTGPTEYGAVRGDAQVATQLEALHSAASSPQDRGARFCMTRHDGTQVFAMFRSRAAAQSETAAALYSARAMG